MKHACTMNKHGFAMLMVMVYMFSASVIIGGVSTAVISAMQVTNTLDATRLAVEAAEYGEAQTVNRLAAGALPLPAPSDAVAALGPSAFHEAGVELQPVDARPDQHYIVRVFRKAVPDGGEALVIYVAGRYKHVTRRIEAIYRIEPPLEGVDASARYARIAWREL